MAQTRLRDAPLRRPTPPHLTRRIGAPLCADARHPDLSMSSKRSAPVNGAEMELDIVTAWMLALNESDLSRLPPYCSQDLIVHAPTLADSAVAGLEKIALLLASYRTAFPDGRFALQSTYREGDLVCFRWTACGVNSRPFLDFPATNLEVV